MKVIEILLLTITISTCTLGAAPPPTCEAADVNTFKPNYDDSSWYYQCTGVGTYVSLPCYGGKWFSFAHQECVKKSDWLPPFIPTTKPTTNDPFPNEATTISVTIETSSILDENDPPYPSIPTNVTDHPTPPTRPPSEAPTPPQTTAGTPEPTLPKAPPNVDSSAEEPPYPTSPPNHPTPPTPVPTGAATPPPTSAPVRPQTLPDSPPIG